MSPAIRTDTAPCVGCGICCDGTIYSRAAARPDEEERLEAAGLELCNVNGKRWFVHPCRFSKDGLCTIYDQERFEVCRTFRCKLLTAYQAGEVDLDEARETIARTFALRSDVAADEPRAALWRERQELRSELEKTRERPQLLLKIAVLEYWLDRWFRVESTKPGE